MSSLAPQGRRVTPDQTQLIGQNPKAIRQVFGHDVPVQRCVQHKERNVLDHRQDTDHDIALEQLTALALELDRAHPGAASSLREGLEETLTVTRLGTTGKLQRTLQSTNPCGSMVRRAINRNVKNWSSGEMAMRWTTAGMLEAETRSRKVEGYRGLANLAVAIERDLTRRRKELATTLGV